MAERNRPRKRKLPSRADLRKGRSIIPSLFTIGNIFCGYYSMVSAFRGNYDYAAIAIGIGTVLDGLDGRIARLTQTSSDFGLELDSLADVLTFGVAPAILAFSWGLTAIQAPNKHIFQFGWFVAFAFLLCGTLRLARFNSMSKKATEASSKRSFVGLPIPAGAGMLAAMVHYCKEPILQVGSALLWFLLVALVGCLMISTVRYSSFKELDLKRVHPFLVLLIVGGVIWSIVFYSEYVLLAIATVYASSGPVAKLVQTVRRILPPSVRPSEPAHGNIRS